MSNSKHIAVGALIVKGNKILLIDRSTFPIGFAFPAGHLEEGESPVDALKREIKEETNLDILSCDLIGEEILKNNSCNKGSSVHHWFIFSCKVKGRIKKNKEAHKVFWLDIKKLKKLPINKTWSYWLKKFNYL